MTKFRNGLVELDDKLLGIYAITALSILKEKYGDDYVDSAIEETSKIMEAQMDTIEATSRHEISKSPFGKMMLDVLGGTNDQESRNRKD